jgi:hypothetical protein
VRRPGAGRRRPEPQVGGGELDLAVSEVDSGQRQPGGLPDDPEDAPAPQPDVEQALARPVAQLGQDEVISGQYSACATSRSCSAREWPWMYRDSLTRGWR